MDREGCCRCCGSQICRGSGGPCISQASILSYCCYLLLLTLITRDNTLHRLSSHLDRVYFSTLRLYSSSSCTAIPVGWPVITTRSQLNMRRCPRLQSPSGVCRNSAWHGAAWNGLVKGFTMHKYTLTTSRSARRCTSPRRRCSSRCRERSRSTSDARTACSTLWMAGARQYAQLQL